MRNSTLPKWRNSCVPGLLKPKGKVSRQRHQKGKKATKDKLKGKSSAILLYRFTTPLAQLCPAPYAGVSGRGVGRKIKEKSPDIFIEIRMWSQHFLKTWFYVKSVHSAAFSSVILWAPIISVLSIWVIIFNHGKYSSSCLNQYEHRTLSSSLLENILNHHSLVACEGKNLVGLNQGVGWSPSVCFPVITFIGTFLFFLSFLSLSFFFLLPPPLSLSIFNVLCVLLAV